MGVFESTRTEEERNQMVAEGGHEFDPPQLDFELDNPFDDSDDSDVVEMDDAGDDQIFVIVEAPKDRRVHVTIDPVERGCSCGYE